MFAGLSSGDLRHLATLLAQNRIEPPYSTIALQRDRVLGATVLGDLEALNAEHFTSLKISRLVTAIAKERERIERPPAQIQLVATGPDANARTRDTSVVIEQLFGEATKSVLIVGFAIYGGREIFKTLADRMDRLDDLNVVCCFDVARAAGETAREADIVDRFALRFVKSEWSGHRLPDVYYDPRSLSPDRDARAVLHAKTIVIDCKKAIVTSANPTPAAYLRNIELGLVITGGEIPQEIDRHFQSLIAAGWLKRLPL
jgi:phosphatidylserine/phosphatidylglycerophosphate/cardiolipin synthase-like enzyme